MKLIMENWRKYLSESQGHAGVKSDEVAQLSTEQERVLWKMIDFSIEKRIFNPIMGSETPQVLKPRSFGVFLNFLFEDRGLQNVFPLVEEELKMIKLLERAKNIEPRFEVFDTRPENLGFRETGKGREVVLIDFFIKGVDQLETIQEIVRPEEQLERAKRELMQKMLTDLQSVKSDEERVAIITNYEKDLKGLEPQFTEPSGPNQTLSSGEVEQIKKMLKLGKEESINETGATRVVYIFKDKVLKVANKYKPEEAAESNRVEIKMGSHGIGPTVYKYEQVKPGEPIRWVLAERVSLMSHEEFYKLYPTIPQFFEEYMLTGGFEKYLKSKPRN